MTKEKKTAISIFFIAVAVGLNITGILPVLGVLNEEYQEYGTRTVQLLQTIPYLFLMIGSLQVGWWTTRVSKKKIVLFGLLIIGFSGTIPFFSESFYLLFASRVIIGFGFGIVSPLNTAIITEMFDESERAGYMGLHVVGMGVGTMTGNLLGGIFSGFGIRFFYLVYLLPFVSWLFVKLLLKETPPVQVERKATMKLNKMVYALSFVSFAHTLFINAYNTNIGIYVLQNITDDTRITGIVTAVNAAFALLMGAFFAKIAGLFKKYTVGVSVLAAAVGYGTLIWIPGIAGVYIASALCGVSLSCFMSGCSILISTAVMPEVVAKASGVFSVIGGIGGLIAPIVIGNVSLAVFGENTADNQFVIAFIGMLVLAAVILIFTGRNKKTDCG